MNYSALTHSESTPILFLVMEFAPVNTTGNFRSLKFVKYLRQFGIEPIVVTFKSEEAVLYFNARTDKNLLNDIPANTTIYRIHCDDDKKYFKNRIRTFFTIYFSIKDTFAARWKRHLFKELGPIISRHQPKAIFTTLPPFSSGMLALEVSRVYKLPLITDMRDAWAMWGYSPFGTRLHFNLILGEEEKIFRHSSAIIGVTPQVIRNFKRYHPKIEPGKFHYIPNGFDGSRFHDSTFNFPANKKNIRIGYVGSFYYNPESRKSIFKSWWKREKHRKFQYTAIKEDWLYRSPYFFFKTMAAIFEQYPEMKEVIKLEFVGNKSVWMADMIKEFSLEKNIMSHGLVSHEEALKIQQQFDLVLATSEKVIGDEHYCLPSKIFDSIGMNIPIVAFVTDGIQKEFIEKSGLGIICDPDNTKQSAIAFMNIISNGRTFTLDLEYINSFHRKNLTAKLASVCKTVIAE